MPIDRSQAQAIATEIIEAMSIRLKLSPQEIQEQIEQGNVALRGYFTKQIEARLFRIASADPGGVLKQHTNIFPKSPSGRKATYHPSSTQHGRIRAARAFLK